VKKIRIVLMCLAVALVLASAVYRIAASRSNGEEGAITQSIASFMKGDVTGEVGKEYRTKWFKFTVHSIDRTGEYAGYKPEDGAVLLDVVIDETCTFKSPIDMGTFDFYIDAESLEEYIYPIDPLNDTMMPEEFRLEPKDKKQYHMIYEVPGDMNGLKLIYTEVDEDDNTHATFTINIKDA